MPISKISYRGVTSLDTACMHDPPLLPLFSPISGVSMHIPSVHMCTAKELHGYKHALEEIEGILPSMPDVTPGPGEMAGGPMWLLYVLLSCPSLQYSISTWCSIKLTSMPAAAWQ